MAPFFASCCTASAAASGSPLESTTSTCTAGAALQVEREREPVEGLVGEALQVAREWQDDSDQTRVQGARALAGALDRAGALCIGTRSSCERTSEARSRAWERSPACSWMRASLSAAAGQAGDFLSRSATSLATSRAGLRPAPPRNPETRLAILGRRVLQGARRPAHRLARLAAARVRLRQRGRAWFFSFSLKPEVSSCAGGGPGWPILLWTEASSTAAAFLKGDPGRFWRKSCSSACASCSFPPRPAPGRAGTTPHRPARCRGSAARTRQISGPRPRTCPRPARPSPLELGPSGFLVGTSRPFTITVRVGPQRAARARRPERPASSSWRGALYRVPVSRAGSELLHVGALRRRELEEGIVQAWSTFASPKTIWFTSPWELVTTLASTCPSLPTTKRSFCTPGVGFSGVSSRPSPAGSPRAPSRARGANSFSRSPLPQRKVKALLS